MTSPVPSEANRIFIATLIGLGRVVTASTSDTGMGIARRLAARGADIVINGLSDRIVIEAECSGGQRNPALINAILAEMALAGSASCWTSCAKGSYENRPL